MKRAVSSLMSCRKLKAGRVLAIAVIGSAVALGAAAPSFAVDVESVDYDLSVGPGDHVVLNADFTVSESDVAATKKLLSGSSGLLVSEEIIDDTHTLSVTVSADSAVDFENAYESWGGTRPTLELSEAERGFFSEDVRLAGTLPAPAFVYNSPPVVSTVSLGAGQRAVETSAQQSGLSRASGASLRMSSEFPIAFDAKFTKHTTKGIVVNIACAGAVLFLLIYGVRALLKKWDKSLKKK